MRHLYLVRHARANAIAPSDKLRALDPSGRVEAARIGALFQSQLAQPEQVLCSSATRTIETFEIMKQEGLAPSAFEIDEDVYNASAAFLYDKITSQRAQSLLVIGHNPALAILLNRLAGEEDMAPDLMHFPTATIAHLQVEEACFGDLSDKSVISLKCLIRGSQC